MLTAVCVLTVVCMLTAVYVGIATLCADSNVRRATLCADCSVRQNSHFVC
jgi:hypothetical protein